MTDLWAILPSELEHIRAVVAGHDNPLADADPEAVEQMYAARPSASRGSTAIVPVFGMISHRDSLLTLLMGGTSTNRLTAQLRQLGEDETVSRVMLHIDSPGGSVAGVHEAATAIRDLRETKPVTALINPVGASAAYWLAAQATEVVASPDAVVGSVGVVATHVDMSEALEREGINVTTIASSPLKAEGFSEAVPLSDEGRKVIQDLVDANFKLMLEDIAKGRDITAAEAREQFGDGAVLSPKAAKSVGMIDRIATYSETLGRLSGARAEMDLELEAETEVMTEAEVTPVDPRAMLDVEDDAFIFGG